MWARENHGFRALIAPSFADIFHGNCLKNGLLPLTLARSEQIRAYESTRRALEPWILG